MLGRLHGTHWIVASLLYGSGLRLLEALRPRVKDLDFERGEIVVRRGKGRRDRVTPLFEASAEALAAHLGRVRDLHRSDLAAGWGPVELPGALVRKYAEANREWGWQFVFPASRRTRTPRTS